MPQLEKGKVWNEKKSWLRRKYSYENCQKECVVHDGQIKLAERDEDQSRKREVSHERVHALRFHLGDDVEPVSKHLRHCTLKIGSQEFTNLLYFTFTWWHYGQFSFFNKKIKSFLSVH